MTQADTIAPTRDILKMSGVAFSWNGPRKFAISIDSFALRSGTRTLLLGPSGSGKSTLLGLICGIIKPTTGAIRILGTDVAQLSSAARDRFRAEHLGIIFQMFNLLPYGSIIDNVELPLSFAEKRRKRVIEAGGVDTEATRLLQELGLETSLMGGSTAQASVGQQQRVAAARALIGSPELIVADEPTSALDRVHQKRFLELLFSQIEASGGSLLMVSHDETLADQFDHVLYLPDVVKTKADR